MDFFFLNVVHTLMSEKLIFLFHSRVRYYIGPQSYCNWPDKEARDKMERDVQTIQTKADQIYNKFKSFFAYQVVLIISVFLL